ncbi:MBL fold metallo-hydrolase [Mycolicibacterium fortuitum]|uniref:MBL fold metallo-hydrolase n=1 Tax=Mycolicibacterium fortuitum TaxID=1766 RepID=UPI0007ECCC33|nr:MBL fold metallo-hydrolase [Mycolicibacterium fortuitum]OBI76502.1 MBL fold metallo-hydrolase [Mycolicibacterium fortuitum]
MEITVTFVGNATTLIAVDDITLLTDPNFLHLGQHAYLGYGLLSKRLRQPALTVEQLPPVDAVLLSHMHGDHWDRVTQRKLDRALPILTTPHAAKRLARRGFSHATGMSTWQSHRIVKGGLTVTVTSMPGRHAPTPVDRLLPPVMGSMIEFTDGAATRRLYVSGDTLFVDELREIPVPAGSKLPFGLTVTMDAGQGADLVELLDLPKMIPVHFDDYSVFASSLNDFRAEMARRGLGDWVIELDRGASVAY